MNPPASSRSLSIPTLRNLILVCLVVGVGAFTAAMFSIAQELSRRFGPQVEGDLRWRAARGAQELARAADLGLAADDAALVRSNFGAYAESDDVQAIVALGADGHVVAQHGTAPETPASLFRGTPGAVRIGPDCLVSWASSEIEGAAVGKIAVVVSTRRHTEALALLARSRLTVLVGGLLALLLGGTVVIFFTRAVAQRDAQLFDYAKNLEHKVEARTHELDARNRGMRLVLDNVAQGFITIDLDGVMASERSAVLDRWFTPPAPEMRISEYLAEAAPEFAGWLELGLDQLRDGLLPMELTLAQMPGRLESQGRSFEVSYSLIDEAGRTRLLVIISDVTEALARERAEREQRELVALFQRITVDRHGVEEFLAEAATLVAAVRAESDPIVQRRVIHTLKGNCAIYGLESYAELAHEIESELTEHQNGLSDEQRDKLVGMWKEAMQRVAKLLGGARRDVVEIERSELDALRVRVEREPGSVELLPLLAHWSQDPIEPRLERLAQQARAVARRLGKPEPIISIDARGIRLSSPGFSAYWSAMVHVVRNAVDHGIESAQQRRACGKPEAGTLLLSARRSDGQLTIEVRDDGAGVSWERIREKARAAGLAHTTQEQLIEAMFADGLSTKNEASAISGRGVGLAALRETVRDLGGSIEVSSNPGAGTSFAFSFEEQSIARAMRKGRPSLSSLLPSFS